VLVAVCQPLHFGIDRHQFVGLELQRRVEGLVHLGVIAQPFVEHRQVHPRVQQVRVQLERFLDAGDGFLGLAHRVEVQGLDEVVLEVAGIVLDRRTDRLKPLARLAALLQSAPFGEATFGNHPALMQPLIRTEAEQVYQRRDCAANQAPATPVR